MPAMVCPNARGAAALRFKEKRCVGLFGVDLKPQAAASDSKGSYARDAPNLRCVREEICFFFRVILELWHPWETKIDKLSKLAQNFPLAEQKLKTEWMEQPLTSFSKSLPWRLDTSSVERREREIGKPGALEEKRIRREEIADGR